MRMTCLPVLLGFCLLGLVACDEVVNRASAEFLKYSLRDVCGEDDPPCIEAVDTQFDACHAKYRREWNAYLKSTPATDQDALLEDYSKKIYACIVDENGDPWFIYDPS